MIRYPKEEKVDGSLWSGWMLQAEGNVEEPESLLDVFKK